MKTFPILFVLLLSGHALAASSDRSATTLVLIVASNRGPALDRPPLQYADDDGAKYHTVFAALAGEANTTLLTEFDSDTVRLFPKLAGKVALPTRANLDAARLRFAERALAARQRGEQVRFYFVFAGHGDVDEGRGFLELADGAFTADDLDNLLRGIGADESHVILDSCNSFFVVNPRKPGGRRFATPRDAAERLSHRLPNVGVFLSTSAESEVFEWSELQSGVFSHAVRSGLLGAADANRDGHVSYEELAAFVNTATAEIKNPLYRPKVYARGPNGDDDRTLYDLSRMNALTVTVDDSASMRLALRDRDGLRWLDAHKESGQTLDLHVPEALSGRIDIERLATTPAASGRVQAHYHLPEASDKPVSLAQLEAQPTQAEPRGADEIFRGLFARPFGARALLAYQEQKTREPEPVFGISREDTVRMGLLLEQLGATQRQERQSKAAINFGMAAVFGTYFGLAARDATWSSGMKGTYIFDGGLLAGLNLGAGLYFALHISEREQIYRRFREDISKPGADQAHVAASIETRLQEIQEEEQRMRRRSLIAGYVLTGLCGGLVVFNELAQEHQDSRVIERGFILALTGEMLALTLKAQFQTSPTDKFIELWRSDPRHRPLDLSVAPVAGGAMFGLSGRF
jgi:hypothetical protein